MCTAHAIHTHAHLKNRGHILSHTYTVLSSIDKGSFIDLLKGQKVKGHEVKGQEVKGREGSSQWSVLKEDYLLGARMRDWREGEERGEGEEGRGGDKNSSDSGSDDK